MCNAGALGGRVHSVGGDVTSSYPDKIETRGVCTLPAKFRPGDTHLPSIRIYPGIPVF